MGLWVERLFFDFLDMLLDGGIHQKFLHLFYIFKSQEAYKGIDRARFVEIELGFSQLASETFGRFCEKEMFVLIGAVGFDLFAASLHEVPSEVQKVLRFFGLIVKEEDQVGEKGEDAGEKESCNIGGLGLIDQKTYKKGKLESEQDDAGNVKDEMKAG